VGVGVRLEREDARAGKGDEGRKGGRGERKGGKYGGGNRKW